jgi:hypothetical protein
MSRRWFGDARAVDATGRTLALWKIRPGRRTDERRLGVLITDLSIPFTDRTSP